MEGMLHWMKIKLITYMRANENLNYGIKLALESLKKIDNNIECVIFTDEARTFETIDGIKIVNEVMFGTKYIRLLYLIDKEVEECIYISLDNDMIINTEVFAEYVKECCKKQSDFSWARIQAQENRHFISKLVSVDKLLSHDVIRPLLWKLKMGLSIPGQCFLLKPSAFIGKLYKMDTFLDDLALGAYINQHFDELNVYVSDKIIGYEYPNENFIGLCRQRKRWAKGYYQVLKASIGKDYFMKVILHGISYHLNWVLNWLIAGLLYFINPFLLIVYIIILSIIIARKRLDMIVWCPFYYFVFPIFHLVWIVSFLKGEKNNGNG